MTDHNEWRIQSLKNKQGSGLYINENEGEELTEKEKWMLKEIRDVYDQRLSKGVAREQARKDLPLSTYTEAYWKIDLHNLLHFLALRMDGRAQFEIRNYANIIGYKIVKLWCPSVWEAFLDYKVGALNFSRIELEVIKRIKGGKNEEAISYAIERGLLPRSGEIKKNREREELESNLEILNIPIPWRK